MKKLILPIIIVVHLIVLVLLVGPCGGEHSASSPKAVSDKKETPEARTESGTKSSEQSPSPGEEPFSQSFFRRELRELPTSLKGQADVCKNGLVVDWSAKTILWEKKSSESVPIASLTKMMTAWLVARDLETSSTISLSTRVPVTEAASKIGGRQVWLDPRETFTVDELLKCVLIRSANDCAYLLAQFFADGDHARFVTRMNAEAARLGLSSMTFYNAHGLPPDNGPENSGNAQELAYLAGHLLAKPEIVKWSSVRLDYIRQDTKPFQLVSTNKLLERVAGVNGMKTGYTNKSGYCIVVTCDRSGRQVIVVVLGSLTGNARDALTEALLEWAYAQ